MMGGDSESDAPSRAMRERAGEQLMKGSGKGGYLHSRTERLVVAEGQESGTRVYLVVFS